MPDFPWLAGFGMGMKRSTYGWYHKGLKGDVGDLGDEERVFA